MKYIKSHTEVQGVHKIILQFQAFITNPNEQIRVWKTIQY